MYLAYSRQFFLFERYFNWHFSQTQTHTFSLLTNKENVADEKRPTKRMRINDFKMFSFRMKNSLVLSLRFDDTAAAHNSRAISGQKKAHSFFQGLGELAAHYDYKRLCIFNNILPCLGRKHAVT